MMTMTAVVRFDHGVATTRLGRVRVVRATTDDHVRGKANGGQVVEKSAVHSVAIIGNTATWTIN